MPTSKMQREFAATLSKRFPDYTVLENSRPDWCISERGERLELDFWILELDVAIEIQGQQHYQYTPYFHQSYEDFKAQQQRDEAKKKRCIGYGITLLEVDDRLSFDKAIDDIREIAKVAKKLTKASLVQRRHFRAIKGFLDQLSYIDEIEPPDNDIEYAETMGQLCASFFTYFDRHGAAVFGGQNAKVSQLLFAKISEVKRKIDNNKGKRWLLNTQQSGNTSFMPHDKAIWHFYPVKRGGQCFNLEVTVIAVKPNSVLVRGMFEGEKKIAWVRREKLTKIDV